MNRTGRTMWKEKVQEKKRWITGFLLIALLMLTMAVTVAAEEEDNGAATGIPAVTITECRSGSATWIELTVPTVGKEDSYSYDIYRAASAGGTYKKLDSIDNYCTYWSINSDDSQQTTGKNKKVVCVKTSTKYYFYDTSVKFNTTYFYKIQRRNYGQTKGVMSAAASAKAALGTTSIIKGYALDSQVKLTWQAVAKAQGYYIYRKTNGAWKKIATVKKQKTVTYTDKNTASGKNYQYRIKAYAKSGGKTVTGSYSSVYKVTTKTPTVSGNYNTGSVYGPSLGSGQLQEVRKVVQSFKQNFISSKMTAAEKLYTAFSYLRGTCSYAYRGWQYNGANTAWGALVYGEAQCSGYARGFKALCDSIGIPCYYVHANSQSANPSHQWNEVKLKGKWYIIDVQAGIYLVSAKTYKTTGMRWDENAYPKCSTDYK